MSLPKGKKSPTSFCRSAGRSGKSKRGLSKGGLSPKGANRAKKGPFGAISALPPWLWGAEELVPIGPEKAPTSPEMAPICPEKARFSGKDFPPIFSENLGLKPPFVSPRLDFPKENIQPYPTHLCPTHPGSPASAGPKRGSLNVELEIRAKALQERVKNTQRTLPYCF